MELGRHLEELWRLRLGVAVCFAIAIVAALAMTSRSLQIASASTEVLVDTPRSAVLDLRQDLADIDSLTNRTVLLGNVMASEPVLAYIGRRAGVPPDAIRASTPRTPNSPRPFAAPGQERKTSDLLRSTDQYRLDIEANPTVPVLRIYAQASTARAAGELANAAVDGLRDYLDRQARAQRVAPGEQVRLQQLGRASGTVINGAIRLQVMFLTFLLVFAAAAAAAIFTARVRRGFQLAAMQSG
jgi:uncharacterized protein involved in exopolysaccharide biosynthesis